MKEFKLPSGAVLKIMNTPFAESKALYQALLREAKSIQFNAKLDLAAVIKDLFCAGFSSPEVEVCLDRCLQRCVYNCGKGDLKIDVKSTFEPEAAREDYTVVCLRVIEENIAPFVKGLSVELDRVLAMIPGIRT